MNCFPPIATGTALGRLTIDGVGVECQEFCSEPECFRQRRVCNNTTISVTINGVTVSATAREGSTGASVAAALAGAINNNATLSAIVYATVSGNVVTVSAAQPGMEHTYPWNSSCRHSLYFGECAFDALRAPIATLAP